MRRSIGSVWCLAFNKLQAVASDTTNVAKCHMKAVVSAAAAVAIEKGMALHYSLGV